MITALEHLRINSGMEDVAAPFSNQPFGIGIWVGGGFAPNKLQAGSRRVQPGALGAYRQSIQDRARNPQGPRNRLRKWDFGAIEHLVAGDEVNRANRSFGTSLSEPAQIIGCPACDSPLSIPFVDSETPPGWGDSTLPLLLRTNIAPPDLVSAAEEHEHVGRAWATAHNAHATTLRLQLKCARSEDAVEAVWANLAARFERMGPVQLAAARASRPGYFLRTRNARGGHVAYDFMICCPNEGHEGPEGHRPCPLSERSWSGHVPAGSLHEEKDDIAPPSTGSAIQIPFHCGRTRTLPGQDDTHSASTVDDGSRGCPSLLIATVDNSRNSPSTRIQATCLDSSTTIRR